MSILYDRIRKVVKDHSQEENLSPILESLANIEAQKLTDFEEERFNTLINDVLCEAIKSLLQTAQLYEGELPPLEPTVPTIKAQYARAEKNRVVMSYLTFHHPGSKIEAQPGRVEILEIAETIPGTTQYSIIKMTCEDGRIEYATGRKIPTNNAPSIPAGENPIHVSTFNGTFKDIPYYVKSSKEREKIIRENVQVQQHIENLLKNLQIIERMSEKFSESA
jgi:hypothetical protein